MSLGHGIERASRCLTSIILATALNPYYAFTIDTIAFVRDYCECHPHMKEIIKKLYEIGRLDVCSGSISQFDENLVSIEGILRDYFYGIEWVKTELGIMPRTFLQADVFRHSPITPALLNLFGFKHLAFGRGAEGLSLPLTFTWRCPIDRRSEVVVFYEFYNEFFDTIMKTKDPLVAIETLIERLKPRVPEGVKYIGVVVGADFIEADTRLVNVAKLWNEKKFKDTGTLVIVSTLSKYFEYLEKCKDRLPIREVDINPLWKGFYASRIKAKIYERELTNKLLAIEKLYIVLKAKELVDEEVFNKIKELWWLLSMNHHHDTITGTSPDRVWESSELVRYEKIKENADKLLHELASILAEHSNIEEESCIVIINNLPWPRADLVITKVPIKGGFILLDGDKEIAYDILDVNEEGTLIAFKTLVPPCGYKIVRVIEELKPKELEKIGIVETKDRFVMVTIGNTRITIDMKSSASIVNIAGNVEFKGKLGYIAAITDKGDAWSLRPEKEYVECCAGEARLVKKVVGGNLILLKFRIKQGDYNYYKTIVLTSNKGNIRIYEVYDLTTPDVKENLSVLIRSRVTIGGSTQKLLHGLQIGFIERKKIDYYPTYTYVALQGKDYGIAIINYGVPGNKIVKLMFLGNVVEFKGKYQVDLLAFRHLPHPPHSFSVNDPGPHMLKICYMPYEGELNESNVIKVAQEVNKPLVAIFVKKEKKGLAKVLSCEEALLEALPHGKIYADLIPLAEDKVMKIVGKYDNNVQEAVIFDFMNNKVERISLDQMLKTIGIHHIRYKGIIF
ncbi:MAG: hypothetical protein J7J99_09055 [Thermoprotei archaeon]|nr:hypothetical protein [Thermoprotei archaeon]